jgi:hypothetical protein
MNDRSSFSSTFASSSTAASPTSVLSVSPCALWALGEAAWQIPCAQGHLQIKLTPLQESLKKTTLRRIDASLSVHALSIAREDAPRYSLLYELEESEVALAALQLREQSDYLLEASWDGEEEASLRFFPTLQAPIFQRYPAKERKSSMMGRLNFRDYIGGSQIEIYLGEVPLFSTYVEIRSQKLDSRRDDVALLNELGDYAAGLLLQPQSPVFQVFQTSQQKRPLAGFERYLLLRHLLRQPALASAFEQISRQPLLDSERCERWQPASQSPKRTPQAWLRGMQRGITETLFPSQLPLPRSIPVPYTTAHFERWENQILLAWLRDLEREMRDLETLFYKEQEIAPLIEIQRMQRRCQRWFAMLPFAHLPVPALSAHALLSRYTAQIGESQRKSPAYGILFSFILQSYKIISLGKREKGSSLLGGLRDMAKLYEYWSFFSLWRALSQIAEPAPWAAPRLVADKTNLQLQLARGNESLLRFRWRQLTLSLYYHLRYEVGQGALCSYSVPMTPDFSLVIEQPDAPIKVLCFDAKYRSDGALEKMHTYRDALRSVVGVYLLYPGDQEMPSIFTRDPMRPFLGVGAFPLRPQATALQRLAAFLSVLFEEMAAGATQ